MLNVSQKALQQLAALLLERAGLKITPDGYHSLRLALSTRMPAVGLTDPEEYRRAGRHRRCADERDRLVIDRAEGEREGGGAVARLAETGLDHLRFRAAFQSPHERQQLCPEQPRVIRQIERGSGRVCYRPECFAWGS